MFKYTNFPTESAQPLNSPKPRTRCTSIPKPVQCSERPVSASRTGKPGTPQNDKVISERYTNRTYNRVPSPKGRFQSLANAAKDRPPFVVGKPSTLEEQRSKPTGRFCERTPLPKPLPRSIPVKQSCSDVINKKRPLDMECNKSNIQAEVDLKARPKTSQSSRAESRLEHKVLHTVESVLSRALLQQGKIDETNIENIINSMRNSLYLEKNLDDEELSEIDIALKPSRTTVNEINLSDEHYADKKIKPVAGIIRRDSSSIPERKPYRKIYDQLEPSMTKNEGDDKTFVCVDLPDLVFPNFPSSKKTDGKSRLKPNIEATTSKHTQMETTKREGLLKQFEVGDSQTKENHFWNSSEDAKLHEYIESLIHNMKTQVNCNGSGVETEGEIDSQGTFCRSFCVCKVCISKNTQSKTVLKQKPSRAEVPSAVNIEKHKPQDSTSQRSPISEESKPPVQRGAGNRLRLQKPSPKGTDGCSPCKVIRNTNPNFKPESSLNTSLEKNTSYTVVDTGTNSEEGDDMYLQRRMRKAPSRRTSANIK